jgi:hypothetical protein
MLTGIGEGVDEAKNQGKSKKRKEKVLEFQGLRVSVSGLKFRVQSLRVSELRVKS